MIRMFNGRIRIPDVAYFSYAKLPCGKAPTEPVPTIVPDLAVEMICEGNTPHEMSMKLSEYFQAGTRLVWYVRPYSKTIDVYTAVDQIRTLSAAYRLTGGDVIPGFEIAVGDVFDVE